MIVIFGASSDVGTKLAAILHWRGREVRAVSKTEANLSTGSGVGEALFGATIVVSCAHAKFTECILSRLPATVESVVLMGSAWRYSAVPNERADQVRQAERLFLQSGRHGIMLHPTMIYGGAQENNVQRLILAIKKFPVIVAPGGGAQQVQPIHIDDVVACLLSATEKSWGGPKILAVAGPPLKWRDMAHACAASVGITRRIIGVPIPVATLVAHTLGRMAGFDPGIVARFAEDVSISLDQMIVSLCVTPRKFEVGIKQAIASWSELPKS